MIDTTMSNSMKYIDVHCHINLPEYDVDRDEVIKRAADAGVGMIAVGTDLMSSQKAVEIAEKYQNVWAIVGLHPADISRADTGAVCVLLPRLDRAACRRIQTARKTHRGRSRICFKPGSSQRKRLLRQRCRDQAAAPSLVVGN